MKSASARIVTIAEPKGKSKLTKSQALFNRLIKKIDQGRKQLMAWQEALPLCQQKCAAELEPLSQEFNAHRAEMIRLLDHAYSDKMFRKNDKAKISDIICSVAGEILAESEIEDLKQIYNKHSQGDFDAEVQDDMEAARSMMEDMLGMDLGDDDIDFRSPEEVIRHISEKMQQNLAQKDALQEETEERPAQRKKSAKALAREARLQEEAKNVSQSIREVYRKLISSLHPDREQDIQERNRKTALMQRVNVAYDKKDLLGLLELQLEIEQIDQTMINTLTEDRLKYYNKVLTEQAEELQQEVSAIELSFRMRFDIPPRAKLSPATAMRMLENDIADLRMNIEAVKADLALFKDRKNLKSWLKGYRIPAPSLFGDDFFDENPFDDMDMNGRFGR